MFSRALYLAIALLIVFSTNGHAQTRPTSGTERVVYSVSLSDVAGILAARGLIVETDTSQGRPVARAYLTELDRQQKNPLFFVGLAACDMPNQPPGCLGLHLARITAIPGQDYAKAQRVAQAFHGRYSFGRVYPIPLQPNPVVVLDYYTMTDRGVTMAHLESVTLEYVGLIQEFLNTWNGTQ
jgi:hypothetical protein